MICRLQDASVGNNFFFSKVRKVEKNNYIKCFVFKKVKPPECEECVSVRSCERSVSVLIVVLCRVCCCNASLFMRAV